MSIKFTDLQGKASKGGPDRFKPVEGENRIRIVGNVVPGYKYWLPAKDGSGSLPVDCLSFNRETEVFDNSVRDVVREYFPEKKCSWAYASFIIDRADKKLKLFDHKKKLFEAILKAAKSKFGDPTDPEKGWDIVFTKEKTGPKVFNVEYSLDVFNLENSPLSEDDLALIEEAGKIEDLIKLPTPEEQETFIKSYILPGEEEVEEEVEHALTGSDDLQ
jgi:hypothetical protein